MLSADLSCRTEGVSSFVVAPGNIYIRSFNKRYKANAQLFFSSLGKGLVLVHLGISSLIWN